MTGADSVELLEITVNHEAGLHLRPAAMFVQTAARFRSDIRVCNASRGSDFQNAKSALAVLTLRVAQGDRIRIQANGLDAVDAVKALKRLIEANFVLDTN